MSLLGYLYERTFSLVNTPTVPSLLFFLRKPPMKMEQTECFERSAYKIQTPRKYPK